MIRRTIAIPDRLAKQIERLAKKEKRSFSSTICGLAESALAKEDDPFAGWFGAGSSGLGDLGENHEKYVKEIYEKWRD